MNKYDRLYRVVGINEVANRQIGLPSDTELTLEEVNNPEQPRLFVRVAWPVKEIYIGMEVQITGVPKL